MAVFPLSTPSGPVRRELLRRPAGHLEVCRKNERPPRMKWVGCVGSGRRGLRLQSRRGFRSPLRCPRNGGIRYLLTSMRSSLTPIGAHSTYGGRDVRCRAGAGRPDAFRSRSHGNCSARSIMAQASAHIRRPASESQSETAASNSADRWQEKFLPNFHQSLARTAWEPACRLIVAVVCAGQAGTPADAPRPRGASCQ